MSVSSSKHGRGLDARVIVDDEPTWWDNLRFGEEFDPHSSVESDEVLGITDAILNDCLDQVDPGASALVREMIHPTLAVVVLSSLPSTSTQRALSRAARRQQAR